MLDVKNYQLGYALSRNERELMRCKERLHIVEGIIFAVEHPVDILEIMLTSADGKLSKKEMCDAFGMSGQQVQAIMDMRMRAYLKTEKRRFIEEYQELLKDCVAMTHIVACRKLK